jgi:hypothetical protein
MSNYWDFEQTQQMGQMWLEMISKMGSTFTSAKPGAAPPEAARQIRGAVFKAMSEQMDQFMRTEGFLQGIKSTLDQTMDIQSQYKNAATQFRHATEGVAVQDINAVMTHLRQFESRVLDQLEDLHAQMASISQRLDSQNGAGPGKRPATGKSAVSGERISSVGTDTTGS